MPPPEQSTFLKNVVGMFSSNAHGGVTQTFSSFGPQNTTTGPEDLDEKPKAKPGAFDPRALYYSERSKELQYRERYFTGRQHDEKPFDQAGRYRGTNVESWSTQPLMSSAAPEFYVALENRRPGSPKRIGRTIVRRFTAMLFASHRFPQLRSHDPKTQDFAEELSRVACLQQRFSDLRNIGGCCGTAAVSWCYYGGKPIVRTHLGRYVHVLEWADFDSKDVAHAVELYVVPIMVPDEEGVPRPVDHWYRRDWTLTEDVVYEPHPVLEPGDAYNWVRDESCCHAHGDGFAHIEWVTNEADLEPDSVDGQPDYAEQYEAMDSLDLTFSVLVRGTQKNLDPTLVVKGSRAGIDILLKGSDNAIFTGDANDNPGGDAKYLEISGSSVTAGLALFKEQRSQILEDAQCVIADPNEIAAAGTSGAAIELLYMPMVSVCDDRRGTYGGVLARLANRMVQSARRMLAGDPPLDVPVEVEEPVEEEATEGDPAVVGGGPAANPGLRVVPDEPEAPPPVEYYLDLEPRFVEETGPDGRMTTHTEERSPGEGTVYLEWGQYFPPTIADKSAAATALGAANGARPTMSQRTSVEVMSALIDHDATEEWRRVQDEAEQARQRELGLTPGIGGDDLLPASGGVPQDEAPVGQAPAGASSGEPGATADQILDPSSKAPLDPDSGLLTDTDMATIVLVNEARVRAGLTILMRPDGTPDPDGNLTVSEFKAKREARGAAEGEIEGGGAVPAKEEQPGDATVPAFPAPPRKPFGAP